MDKISHLYMKILALETYLGIFHNLLIKKIHWKLLLVALSLKTAASGHDVNESGEGEPK